MSHVLVDESFVTSHEALLVVCLQLLMEMCQSAGDGIEFVEDMIRKQLVSAIGTLL
jgi:hypothetical protein